MTTDRSINDIDAPLAQATGELLRSRRVEGDVVLYAAQLYALGFSLAAARQRIETLGFKWPGGMVRLWRLR